MKNDGLNSPNEFWVSCTCNTCSGLLEFDASLFQSGTIIPCPHCGIDTALYIPSKTGSTPEPAPEPTIPLAEIEEKPVYVLEGCGFSSLEVYDDRVAIVGTSIIGGGSVKTIPFSSITAVQLKQAGIGRGYLQFTIPGGSDGQSSLMVSSDGEFFAGATRGSNSFEYSNGLFMESSKDDLAIKIKTHIEKRIRELRTAPKISSSTSLADELTKLAHLKNQGVLSEDEFQTAKKRLLNS